MAAQQGHFTLCANPCGNQGELIHAACTAPPFDDDEHPNAIKLLIPAKLKPSFLVQLRTMNVTGRSLSSLAPTDLAGHFLRPLGFMHSRVARRRSCWRM